MTLHLARAYLGLTRADAVAIRADLMDEMWAELNCEFAWIVRYAP